MCVLLHWIAIFFTRLVCFICYETSMHLLIMCHLLKFSMQTVRWARINANLPNTVYDYYNTIVWVDAKASIANRLVIDILIQPELQFSNDTEYNFFVIMRFFSWRFVRVFQFRHFRHAESSNCFTQCNNISKTKNSQFLFRGICSLNVKKIIRAKVIDCTSLRFIFF